MKDYEVHLNIDPSVTPVANQHRRIPVNLRKTIADKLKELEENESVGDEATPWVSPLVVVPKPNQSDIRLCVDIRAANKAIQRTRHILPTFEEVVAEIGDARVFSRLDLVQGYHQLLLSKDTRYITTFATHCGLRRYKCLNFGISCASEIFQETIRQTIQDIPNTTNISDDILVYTRDTKSHEAILHRVLQRLMDRGLTLNREKCLLFQASLPYMGHLVSSHGIAPDPEKVQAFKQAPSPTNPTGVRSFLGLVTYCARFIPNLADLSKPLRDLTLKNAPWQWTDREDDAFNQIKEALVAHQVLAYYNPHHHTEVFVNGSPTGVGAILTQRDHRGNTYIVANGSRALSPVEQRYSQLEREALAILFACEKFKLYLLGSRFKIVTDHKPLIPIFDNPRVQPSARVKRWMLKLQAYDFQLIYQPGKENPADYMSRTLYQHQQQSDRIPPV